MVKNTHLAVCILCPLVVIGGQNEHITYKGK